MIFCTMKKNDRSGGPRHTITKVPIVGVLTLLLLSVRVGAQSFEASNCAEYLEEEIVTSFVLVVDRSGSMSEEDGIGQAQRALVQFIERVRPEDEVALVSFSDDVRIDRSFGGSRSALVSAVRDLRPGGSTRLHDAIAAGVRLLQRRAGLRVVVFLTDGNDNMSNLSLRDIRQMNIGENVMLYGVGLGNVDHRSMHDIAVAGGGAYENTGTAAELSDLYDRVRNRYYHKVDTTLSTTSGVTVTSLPAGRTVRINGEAAGTTPLRIDGLEPSSHDITVEFQRGEWSCTVETVVGQRAYIRAREQEVPLSIVVETAPTRAAVFFNDDYVGLSSMVPSQIRNGTRNISAQLVIPSVAPGIHTIRVVAAPEYDFSPNQVMEFPVEVRNQRVYVKAHIFLQQIEDLAGARTRPATAPDNAPSVPGDQFDDIRSRIPRPRFGN